MKTIRVSDDLVLELWPAKVVDPPLVRIVHRDGGQVYVRLDEVRHLVAALVEAVVELLETDDGLH